MVKESLAMDGAVEAVTSSLLCGQCGQRAGGVSDRDNVQVTTAPDL